jgi:hypothetical protein
VATLICERCNCARVDGEVQIDRCKPRGGAQLNDELLTKTLR